MELKTPRRSAHLGLEDYVEATPKNLRLRMKILSETARKRAAQSRAVKVVVE